MATIEPRSPVRVGEAAPDFTLPAVDREGSVSLSDYRDRSPVLLALFRGLYCPFCRRQIVQLAVTREKLQAVGVETLGVVATSPERARLYYRFRPTRVPLAADPQAVTHRAYGAPRSPATPELMQALESTRINPTGELPEPLPVMHAAEALDRLDGFEPNETDHMDQERDGAQVTAQFLVDREGVVRWVNVECAEEGLLGLGKFPTDEQLLAAARLL